MPQFLLIKSSYFVYKLFIDFLALLWYYIDVPKREHYKNQNKKNKKNLEKGVDKIKKFWYNKDVPREEQKNIKRVNITQKEVLLC